MKFLTGLLLIMMSIGTQAQTSTLFVGTYTQGDSEGVYTFDFNPETGTLTNKKLIAKEVNPSYLTFTQDKKFLYVINEVDSYKDGNGSVSTYEYDAQKGYQKINTVSTYGAHPCHISINAAEDRIAISNYSGGNVSLHKIKNGVLKPAFQKIDQNVPNQKAHAHMTQFQGDRIFTADLGRNFITEYTEKKKNQYLLSYTYPMEDKAGPRHFRFTKDGGFIYVINELNSSVSVLKKGDTSYKNIQNISTLSENFEGESFCADIHISPDEQFVYGSNRGENSIVVFKREASGRLSKVQSISVEGNWPRSFVIDPTGAYMFVANERSNNISVFSINKDSGTLEFKNSIDMPSPVCLLF